MYRQRLSLVALVLLLAVPVFAQKFTSQIRGTVTDPTGAAVSGAKVTLTNEGTGVSRTMNSNAQGNFVFPDIPVGSYRVEVEFAGFKLAVQNKIQANVGEVRVADVKLETGAVTETVSVEAQQGVTTVGAEISGIIEGAQVRELPLNGRNFLQLTLLQPGVTAQEGLNTVNKGLAGGSDISVSGGSTTSNLWLIDGADNVDHGSNRTILVYPSIDAIEEFKIQRNNYGAEFGGAGGAQVNLVTRGGTNSLHGSAYFYARRDALNSTDYFLEKAKQDKQKLTWNDFGATLGGPIIKDKLHFFLSYEKNQDKKQEVRSALVPTVENRNGSFSTTCGNTPRDPETGQPFPNNTIPANRISPAGAALLKLFSDPNGSGCGTNWTQAVDAPVDWQQLHARIDWSLTNSTRVMVRYTQDSWKATNANQGLWGDDPFPVVGSNWDQPGRSLVAQLNQTIGQSMTNTLTFSYSANVIQVSRGGTGADGQTPEQIVHAINAAMPSLYPQDQKQHPNEGEPGTTWGVLGAYNGGGPFWNQAPWKNNQDLFVVKDDYSAVFGSHFIKAGILYSYNKKNEEPANTTQESVFIQGLSGYRNSAGVYTAGAATGNPISDLLLRGTVWGTSEIKANLPVEQRWSDIEFYLADSIKLSSRLTADIGVRISHMTPPWESNNRLANFSTANYNPNDPSPCNGMQYPPNTSFCSDLGLAGGTTGVNKYLVPTNAMYFAPRVGLAWDVFGTGKTSIRGGFGIFYNRERVSPGLGVGQNPPLSGTGNATRTLDSNAPVVGNAAASYGAPGNAYEQVAANSHNYQWNASFQQELWKNTVLEVAYVGNQGKDLVGQTNLNEVPAADRLNYALYGNNRFPNGQYGRPLVDDATGNGYNGSIALWTHGRDSIYHGLQVALTSRFGQGSVASLAYTYAKVISNTGIANADGPGLSSLNAYTDSLEPNLDRARGGNDRTHVFSGSVILALPKLEDKGAFVKHVFGDWQVTTIVQAGTGYPITTNLGVSGITAGPGNNAWRPNRAYNGSSPVACSVSTSDKTQYLNPAAWTINGYQLGTNGNSSRYVCDGPFAFQADASIYKNIHLGPRVALQLRLEVFNIFNTVNFRSDTLNSTWNAENIQYGDAAGNPVSANSPARTQILSATPSSNFGQFTQARDPRTMQVGVRLTF